MLKLSFRFTDAFIGWYSVLQNIFFKLNSFSVCKEARPGSLSPEYLVASLSWYLKRERGNKNPFKPHKLEIPEILSTEDQSVRGAPIIAAIFSWLRNSGELRELEPLGTDPSSLIMQQSCKVLQSTAQIRANSRFNRTVQYRVFSLFSPHNSYFVKQRVIVCRNFVLQNKDCNQIFFQERHRHKPQKLQGWLWKMNSLWAMSCPHIEVV